MKTFFKVAAVLVLLICVGLIAVAIHEEKEADEQLQELKQMVAEAKSSKEFIKENPYIIEPDPVPVIVEPKKEEPKKVLYLAEVPLGKELQEWIILEADRMGVNEGYAFALIESESSFRTHIFVHDEGMYSAGLCQIREVNWPEMEAMELDPLNEFDNITYALTLISRYQDKYKDHEDIYQTITACYKCGERGALRNDYQIKSWPSIKERMNYYNNLLGVGNHDKSK